MGDFVGLDTRRAVARYRRTQPPLEGVHDHLKVAEVPSWTRRIAASTA
jgi:hypothetical protein